jgi:glycopeptide antibiotics resistance protein
MHRTPRTAPPPRQTQARAIARWRPAARLAYVAVVLLATLSQLHFDPDAAVGQRLQEGLRPVLSARDVVDGLRNLLLFAGWGLVWCITAPLERLRRSVATAVLTGLLLSLFAETAQLFSPRRQASILDVLTNTSGALLGALAAAALLRAALARRGARSYVGIPMFVFALAYGSAAVLEILLPGMRQELLPWVRGGPLARFRQALVWVEWRLPAPSTFLLQSLLMLPAGSFALAALVEQGRSYGRAFALTAAGGVLLSLLLEVARGGSGQPIEPDMFATHALGVVAGAWLAHRWLPRLTRTLRGRARPVALLACYTFVLMLWRWRPFVLDLDPARIRANLGTGHLMPLEALAMRVDMFSASIVGMGFLLHVPLGALLAVWPLRLRGALAHVLPGIMLVVAMELGQILIAERFFDVTDIIIGASGVLAGWAVMRGAGFRPYGEALPPRGERGRP